MTEQEILKKEGVDRFDREHSCAGCEGISRQKCLVCKEEPPICGMWVCVDCYNKKGE